MERLYFYIQLGFDHVIDLNGLDHLYFIVALSLPFGFKESKKLIWWVTLFTLGHSLSLVGNYYLAYEFSSYWIELLIPITIAISCFPLLVAQPTKTGLFASILTLIFGLIHGLGFGRYFALLVDPEYAEWSLCAFAMGVELAQIIIVMGVLLLNYIIASWTAFGRLWRILVGICILLLAVEMIIQRI